VGFCGLVMFFPGDIILAYTIKNCLFADKIHILCLPEKAILASKISLLLEISQFLPTSKLT